MKRASDHGLSGITISKRKFGLRNTPRSRNAKQYQSEGMLGASDMSISFKDAPNASDFDAIGRDGKLIDRKAGYDFVFDADGVAMDAAWQQGTAKNLKEQVQKKLAIMGGDGSQIRYEVSTVKGAKDIARYFRDLADQGEGFEGARSIEVVWVAQKVRVK